MKKILFSAVGLLLAGSVMGATLTPIQLISPAGSSNGQVITSSGSALSWATPASAPVSSVAGRTGAVTLSVTDVSGAAPTASPAFTGTVASSTPIPVASGGSGVATITGLVLGNGASAMSAYGGTSCTNQFPRSLNASGVSTCATVGSSDLTASLSLTTPNINVATATSINGNIWTTGTGTLTLAASKTLTANNTLTLAGTDATTMTFPTTSATIARTDAANTFIGVQSHATGGSVLLYNTADQVTNTEALRLDWASNVARVGTINGGTGSFRALRAGVFNGANLQDYTEWNVSGPTNYIGGGTAGAVGHGFSQGAGNSSGAQTLLSLTGTITQTGTAGYNALLVNTTESTTGSGAKYLFRAQVGSVDKFTIDDTGAVNAAGSNSINGTLLYSNTAPTISSGFGTSPSVASNNGTLTFRVNIGTGGTASSGVIGLPTAANGWNCTVQEFNPSATALLSVTVVSASGTTSVTVVNDLLSTGAATAWQASQVLVFNCAAY